MRKAGEITGGELAHRFAEVALADRLNVRIEQAGEDQWTVWAIDEDERDRIAAELEAFLADPESDRYADAAEKAQQRRREAELAAKASRKRQIDLKQRWSGPLWKRCPVTVGLAAITCLVALLTFDPGEGFFNGFGRLERPVRMLLLITTYQEADRPGWIEFDGLEPIWEGQIWRVFTPMFLHFGLLHLTFNLMWLWTLGASIELRRGGLRLLLLVLTIAAISNLAEYNCSFELSTGFSFKKSVLFGGLSGVNYGLFGYLWVRAKTDPRSGFIMPQQTAVLMMIWLVICTTGAIGPIANVAHFVGLAVGAAIGAVPWLLSRLQRV
ncbi:rhomboid family intramembrane serine protease [Stratiformator vulcanicus]|uniref:Rhomboid protease GlpG n=1 Tax=Stratiformator vulcanicus TaxID=2527980 RepID=A0A517QXQ0_9PLAN|nr:rhomboid family intramembrane serine protease [Stratiformator vulcanicus]QDT36384.1 Rhomboid protease GlpG [Stratiformator vulcanicus]